jgi:outer membrane protein assembly factor BamA
MPSWEKQLLPFLLSLLLAGNACSQDSATAVSPPHRFLISEIYIKGNHRTKAYIVERELTFHRGDSVSLTEMVERFQRSKDLLVNTRLFTTVIISLKGFRGELADVQIDVTERWYLFPVPYFRPIDRNLSAWADKNYSLARVNYGLKFLYNNFTGRNDRLRVWAISGYTRQLQANYDQPYSGRSLHHGWGMGVLYAALKEVNGATINDRQVFVNPENIAHQDKYLLKQASGFVNYFYRPRLSTRHIFRLGMGYLQADSGLLAYNPHFFANGAKRLLYPEFSYTLEYQHCDYLAYVLKGFAGDLNFTQKGISNDMHLSQLTARFNAGQPLGHRFYWALQGYGAVKLPFDQPYYNQKMLGYGDVYLRGLERYVIDGVAGSLLRASVRKKIAGFTMTEGKIPSLEVIPFSIYAKIFGDAGYVYNRNVSGNALVNRTLYTAGIGIDVVSIYDFVFRCEYSINQLGERGVFLHIRNDF